MRSRWRIALVLGAVTLAGGIALSAAAPALVRTETMRRLGEHLKWSGVYDATTPVKPLDGARGFCPDFEFRPDYCVWEAGARIWGFIGGLLGVGLGGLAWRALSRPVAAQSAGGSAELPLPRSKRHRLRLACGVWTCSITLLRRASAMRTSRR